MLRCDRNVSNLKLYVLFLHVWSLCCGCITPFSFALAFSFHIGFQVSVMAKLDTIIENQQEQNLLLRQIAASSLSSGYGDTLDELIPSKMDSLEELLEFEEKLQDTEFKKKMVICLFVFVLTAHCIYNIIMKHWTYKRLWISWFLWLRFCGRWRNTDITIILSLLNVHENNNRLNYFKNKELVLYSISTVPWSLMVCQNQLET